MPVYMLHRILRDILMFAGIYDYLGDWGWFALFVLICLSICVIYLLVNPKVVNQVNKILTLYTRGCGAEYAGIRRYKGIVD